MIGKIVKGTSFSGCVNYVLKEDKSRLLKAVGAYGSPEEIAEQFELQTLLNDKVKNTVGHISLSFSAEDGDRIRDDDGLMLRIAHDYMKLMGIENTQFIIARHTDRDHPHCHIVYNRVDNDGRTISDKNDRYRNEKVCKMLTARYRLHFAEGKENVNFMRLRRHDKVKYFIYHTLKREVPGLTKNNLRYYRTGFVGRSRSMQNMRKLVNLATDMLCIKENLYTEQNTFGGQKTYKNVFRYFDDGKKQMLIIYREEAIDELVDIIYDMNIPQPIKVYVFSPSEDPWEGSFDDVSDKVELCALPQAIYNTYRRILPKKKDAVVMPEEDALASTQEDKDLFDGMLNFEYDEEA